MSTPTRTVPSEQVRAFGLAVCTRLGIDPDLVGEDVRWEVAGGEEVGRVDLTVHLPADEILAMFNTGRAAVAPPADDTTACTCGYRGIARMQADIIADQARRLESLIGPTT